MSVSIPCVNNNYMTEKYPSSSPAGGCLATPKFWKKRDSIRSRDGGIKGTENRSDSSRPPLSFSKALNPKGSWIPSNQLQTTMVYFDGHFNTTNTGSLGNRKLASASGSQPRKKIDHSLKSEDLSELSIAMKKKLLMEQLVEGEGEGSVGRRVKDKKNMTLKGDRFISIKDTIAAYREVEQVLLVQNSGSQTRPPLLISTNDALKIHSCPLKQSNSEERLCGTGNGQAVKKYKRIWKNQGPSQQPPLHPQTKVQITKNKENSLNTSSSTSATTPMGFTLTSYLASPSAPLPPPRVNNINVFRIKKQAPSSRSSFNQTGEGSNRFCMESRLSLKNEMTGLDESGDLDGKKQLIIHNVPHSTKEQSNQLITDERNQQKGLFTSYKVIDEKQRQSNCRSDSSMRGKDKCNLNEVRIGEYMSFKSEKSKEISQVDEGCFNFTHGQPSIGMDSNCILSDESHVKDDNTSQYNGKESNTMFSEDIISNCDFQDFTADTGDDCTNLMNCAQIHPIFWRQQTIDLSKEGFSDWGLKKVLVIKADALLFGAITSPSFWETSQGTSYFEQFSGKLNELKKSLCTLSRHYLIFFLFSSNSSRIVDLVTYLSKNMFLFDGAYYYTSSTSIYSNKAININRILSDFSISNSRNILFFDSVPTGFSPSQDGTASLKIFNKSTTQEYPQQNSNIYNKKKGNDTSKSKGILKHQIHYDNLNEWIPRIQGGAAKRTRVILLKHRAHANFLLINLKKIVEISLQLADPHNSSSLKLMELDTSDVLQKSIQEGMENIAKNNFLKQINKIKQNNKNSSKDDSTSLDADKVAENFRNRLIEYMKSTQKAIHSLYYLVGDLVVRNRTIFQNYCQEPFHCKKRNTNNLQQLDYLRNAVLHNNPKQLPSRGRQGQDIAKLLQELPNENPYDILLNDQNDKNERNNTNLYIKFYMYIDPV